MRFRAPPLLAALNFVAASVYIVRSLALDLPLELFPDSWRSFLIRWRRSRRAPKRASVLKSTSEQSKREDPFKSNLPVADSSFKAFPALNDCPDAATSFGLTSRRRLDSPEDPLLAGDGLQARLSRELAARKAVDRKEFFEAWEFFAQVREHLGDRKSPVVLVDAAGGHGLLGVICACLDRHRFSRVVIADRRKPASHAAISAAAKAVAPWVEELVEYVEEDFAGVLPAGCVVVSIHGCKSLTDDILKAAIAARARTIAVMPCCYGHSFAAEQAPATLRQHLGVAMAADVQRTCRLENDGYSVQWRFVPSQVTPMNRILLARQRIASGGKNK